jgi:outer membrane lipoprotein-sorting protein
MRKILTVIAAMLVVASAAAQQTQHAALERLRAAISDSCLTLKCTYSMYVSQTRVQGEAEVMLQGNAYAMCGNGIEVYCDGTRVWTLDPSLKEAYVEQVENAGVNALFDPSSADIVFDADGNPVSASFIMHDGLKVDIKVLSATKSKIKPEDAFRPQVDFGSDWIVTEL